MAVASTSCEPTQHFFSLGSHCEIKGAATSAAGKALEIAGSLTVDRRTKVKGFLVRRKGALDKKKGDSKELLDQ
jgi:uncharacterized protein YjbJ (UPF0337 family)